jgi:hypothetical protein
MLSRLQPGRTQIPTQVPMICVCCLFMVSKAHMAQLPQTYPPPFSSITQTPLHLSRVGHNHIYTVYIRCYWQGNHQMYGHIRCIYTVLANTPPLPSCAARCERSSSSGFPPRLNPTQIHISAAAAAAAAGTFPAATTAAAAAAAKTPPGAAHRAGPACDA